MSQITRIEFLWKASRELMQREAVESGRTEKAERVLRVEMADMTAEQRAAVMPAAALKRDVYEVDLRSYKNEEKSVLWPDKVRSYWHEAAVQLDEALTLETAVALTQQYHAINTEIEQKAEAAAAEHKAKKEREQAEKEAADKADFDRLLKIYYELLPGVEALVAGEDLDAIEAFTWPENYDQNFPTNRPYSARWGDIKVSLSHMLYKRAKELRAERDAAEKDSWIKRHGSQHLQRAWAAGHHSGRQYAIERAAQQYPGWTIDYNETAEWSERPFPSLAALDIRDEAIKNAVGDGEPEIVWLTARPSHEIMDEQDEYEFEWDRFDECEAVVVHDPHLGKWLVQIV